MTTTVNQGDKFNLAIPQGSTFKQIFYFKDSDGVAVNLTGYAGRCQFRESIGATVTLYNSTTLGDITIAGSTGAVTLEIPAATTTAWTFRSAVYDLEIVAGDGKVTRLVKGRVRVDQEVTR
jgi:hypothetical protein